jgi:hypothetical protein
MNRSLMLLELFAGKEMGEDTLRLLNDVIPLQTAFRADVAAELPHLRETARWAARLGNGLTGGWNWSCARRGWFTSGHEVGGADDGISGCAGDPKES